jgi:hypothetical protein
MDFRTTYGTLLKTQVEMYARMIELSDKIEHFEAPAISRKSNVYTISRIAIQKERLVVQLDETSVMAQQSMERIESMAMLCQQLLNHPVYIQLLELQIMAEARMREVMRRCG